MTIPFNLASFSKDYCFRFNQGADLPCLFLPHCGEFGHRIFSLRFVAWHPASHKIVCCRPREVALYPTADAFDFAWTDPVPDDQRVGSIRNFELHWPRIIERYPRHCPIDQSRLSLEDEINVLNPNRQLPFHLPTTGRPAVDVVLGYRKREYCPQRNWPEENWAALKAELYSRKITFAQLPTSTAGDCSAAIELLANCRLYVGTDSGASHLASEVRCPMLIFRCEDGSRDNIHRMEQVNCDNVERLTKAWNNPQRVIDRIVERLK